MTLFIKNNKQIWKKKSQKFLIKKKKFLLKKINGSDFNCQPNIHNHTLERYLDPVCIIHLKVR